MEKNGVDTARSGHRRDAEQTIFNADDSKNALSLDV